MGRPATLKVEILADAKGVKSGVDQADGAFGKLGERAGKIGAVVGAGLAAGAVAAGAFAVASVKAASDVQQSFGAVESVFGRNAAQVKAWANSAAGDVGLSKAAYADLAAVVGAQLTGMGQTTAQAAAQTQDLVKRGADLAATFGGTTKDAVEALGSVLKGEFDPAERYGISLKQSDINARLAAEGHDKLTGAALKTATANAALELITEKTTAAHGAFGRESDTLAHQQQVLGAQFENVKATVGAALLPALTALAGWVSTRLLPAAQALAQHLAAQLGPTLHQVGAFVREQVVPALQALGGFITGQLVPAFLRFAGPILGALHSAFSSVSGAVASHHQQLAAVGAAIGTVAGFALKLAPILGTILAANFRVVGAVISTVITLVSTLVDALDGAMRMIGKVAGAAGKVGGVLGKLNPFGGPPLAPMGVPLVGGVDLRPVTSPLATAAFGDAGLSGGVLLAAAGAGTLVVDRSTRNTFHVTGALDPVGTAETIRQLLDDQARRIGAAA